MLSTNSYLFSFQLFIVLIMDKHNQVLFNSINWTKSGIKVPTKIQALVRSLQNKQENIIKTKKKVVR